jgi:hypothetical protein
MGLAALGAPAAALCCHYPASQPGPRQVSRSNMLVGRWPVPKREELVTGVIESRGEGCSR